MDGSAGWNAVLCVCVCVCVCVFEGFKDPMNLTDMEGGEGTR